MFAAANVMARFDASAPVGVVSGIGNTGAPADVGL
jgi:hypothetical protein